MSFSFLARWKMPFATEVIDNVSGELIKVSEVLTQNFLNPDRINGKVVMNHNIAETRHWRNPLRKLRGQQSRLSSFENHKAVMVRHSNAIPCQQVGTNISHVLHTYLQNMQKAVPLKRVGCEFLERE